MVPHWKWDGENDGGGDGNGDEASLKIAFYIILDLTT